MGTHVIPDKVKAHIDRMFEGPERKRVTEALESGKTVCIGKAKLRGVKGDKNEGSATATPAPPAPAADSSETSGSTKRGGG